VVSSLRDFACLGEKKKKILTISQHCFIRREMLVSKTLEEEMKKVSDVATKIVNFIKPRPVHSRMFKSLCENLDKQHINLLLRTEIR
jgi:hypothetical protein